MFAVAMTLLVIDLKLPEHFKPASADELIHGLAELKTQFFVYGHGAEGPLTKLWAR